jgi:hypothetical protein
VHGCWADMRGTRMPDSVKAVMEDEEVAGATSFADHQPH